MAKAPKRSTIADSQPPQATADDWMPLTDAFPHIRQLVGGAELAQEDLRLRLASGEVEVQDRLVLPGVGIEVTTLAPENCVGPYGLLFPPFPELHDDLGPIGHLGFLQQVEMLRFHGHNFFVRRAVVHRIWPMAADHTVEPGQAALPTTRPKELGPKAWLAVKKVWELWVEGYRLPDREQLLQKVRDRIGNNGLSMRTLDEALAYLRRKRLIDR
jgi:hypothetical protein